MLPTSFLLSDSPPLHSNSNHHQQHTKRQKAKNKNEYLTSPPSLPPFLPVDYSDYIERENRRGGKKTAKIQRRFGNYAKYAKKQARKTKQNKTKSRHKSLKEHTAQRRRKIIHPKKKKRLSLFLFFNIAGYCARYLSDHYY